MMRREPYVRASILALLLVTGSAHAGAGPAHGVAMHGAPKYPPDFAHFEYADPGAPKGGELRLAEIGTFDSLNPFILKGMAPAGIGRLFDTLTAHAEDEPFSEYGLIAETIEIAPDRSWVEFRLRPQARFHDGSPVRPADVIFSFETLRKDGHPFYRAYYGDVLKVEQTGPRQVRFRFKNGDNRELALIVGQLPVLPEAYWKSREFTKTTLEPPLGSGPYRVESVDPGRSIVYRRVADYWGADLAVNRGRHNFDRIRHEYYRDTTVALEAFKAGAYDLRVENVARNWATAYDTPALRDGSIRKEEIRHERPAGMQGFVFNTRRPLFADRRVRAALAQLFDFEWTNRNLFHGAYTRSLSFFSNSELAASGAPDAAERSLLEPHRKSLPPEVFGPPVTPPVTDGSGNLREQQRSALALLKEAGYEIRARRLVQRDRLEPVEFEILLVSADFERVVLPFVRNLERIGVTARVRTVDSTQYQNRLDGFDFDMIVHGFGQSLSPGNEQRDYWGSASAATPGSRNLAGVSDPAVDALIERIINAPDRAQLVAATRALDRVLLAGHYVIPHWHLNSFRVAAWDRFSRPKVAPRYGLGLDTWWFDPAKDQRLGKRRAASP